MGPSAIASGDAHAEMHRRRQFLGKSARVRLALNAQLKATLATCERTLETQILSLAREQLTDVTKLIARAFTHRDTQNEAASLGKGFLPAYSDATVCLLSKDSLNSDDRKMSFGNSSQIRWWCRQMLVFYFIWRRKRALKKRTSDGQ